MIRIVSLTLRTWEQAKLKHAQSKAADAARLQSELREKEKLLSEQSESFQEDLRFVFLESTYERQLYQGRLSSAEAESHALRDMLRTYKDRPTPCTDQAAQTEKETGQQDASGAHAEMIARLDALLAERKVAGDVEQMLVQELERREDAYETLEISFEVLESAYGFLAKETVRLEHVVEDRERVLKEKEAQLREMELEMEELPGYPEVIEVVEEEKEDEEKERVIVDAEELVKELEEDRQMQWVDDEEEEREEEVEVEEGEAVEVAEVVEAEGAEQEEVETEVEEEEELVERKPGEDELLLLANTVLTTPTRERFVESPVSMRSSSSSSLSRYETRTPSSASIFSDRSWPATPGLTLDTTSSRSSPSSPWLITPPPIGRRYVPFETCDPPSPSPVRSPLSPDDPSELFGSWSPIDVPSAPHD